VTDAELLGRIRAAFAPVARPARFTNRDHCCECAEHDDLLRSRDLDSIVVEDVGNPGYDPMCFATDEAFLYYFPALARLALAAPVAGRGWYFEQLLFHLTYEGAANRRLHAASPPQREAVLLFLRHVHTTRPGEVSQNRCDEALLAALDAWAPGPGSPAASPPG
jgi:hypothetical protein